MRDEPLDDVEVIPDELMQEIAHHEAWQVGARRIFWFEIGPVITYSFERFSMGEAEPFWIEVI